MKNYTSLEQGRKLAEILDIRTADATYERVVIAGANFNVSEEMQYELNTNIPFCLYGGIGVPAWSLAALLEEMNRNCYRVSFHNDNNLTWIIEYNDGKTYKYINKDNFIDACYEMVILLHKQNLL